MPWEALGIDGHLPKVLAIVATLITIGSGIITIVWRFRTWNRRRLKLLKEFLDDREANISGRRPHLLRKVADAQYSVPAPEEPNVSKEVESAIDLLEHNNVRAAQRKLEELQERIAEKRDFIQRYSEDLNRHQANVSLFLAAIADRRDQADVGIRHISRAKDVLGSDVDVLKYEGLLQLKGKNWSDAAATFQKLEDLAKGLETRHYKAAGADGRGDALRELGDPDGAITAYNLALQRIAQAQPQHRDPVFNGLVLFKMAKLQAEGNADGALLLAHSNIRDSLNAFRSADGPRAAPHIKVATKLQRQIDTALARKPQAPMTSKPTN